MPVTKKINVSQGNRFLEIYKFPSLIITNAAKTYLNKKESTCGTTTNTSLTSFEQLSEDAPFIKASASNDSYNAML